MVNITGEKLHVNQVLGAAKAASQHVGLEWNQLQLIPDAEAARYDLLVEPRDVSCSDSGFLAFLDAFDTQLSAMNMEYAHKRKSRRLHCPCIYRRGEGWATACQRADVAAGKRDGQYKWPYVRNDWNEASRPFVLSRLEASPA